MDYRIFPPEEIVETTVALPLSKSMAARRLVMDFITGGSSALASVDETGNCDDIAVLRDILSAGTPNGTTLNVHGSGTALRLLTALFAATEGCHCTISGNDSLRKRPVAPLVEALRSLGADIRYTVREGYAPLEINGHKLAGGAVALDASQSSQFATALMLAAPLMDKPLTINYTVPSTSGAYVRLTAAMMSQRGVETECDSEGIRISDGMYKTASEPIEPDWSAASFWYEIAAVTAGWVTIPGLQKKSLQADRAAAELFERLGALTEFTDDGAELSATPELFSFFEADVTNTPDLVPPLVVAACLIGVPFHLTGVKVLRYKECDRLAALCEELELIGCPLTIEDYDNVLSWDGTRRPLRGLPVFKSHGDHRMAMALAVCSVFMPGIVVQGAECVEKSYPGFWDDLRNAGFTLADPTDKLPETEE